MQRYELKQILRAIILVCASGARAQEGGGEVSSSEESAGQNGVSADLQGMVEIVQKAKWDVLPSQKTALELSDRASELMFNAKEILGTLEAGDGKGMDEGASAAATDAREASRLFDRAVKTAQQALPIVQQAKMDVEVETRRVINIVCGPKVETPEQLANAQKEGPENPYKGCMREVDQAHGNSLAELDKLESEIQAMAKKNFDLESDTWDMTAMATKVA